MASEILKGYGIENEIVKAPVNMRRGCSFGVLVKEADRKKKRIYTEKRKGAACTGSMRNVKEI